MKGAFGKTVPAPETVNQLRSLVGGGDGLAILVNADPDALACALALKRLFWPRVEPVRFSPSAV